MRLTDKLKKIGEEIKSDPGVRGGIVQALANITRIVVNNLTRQPELRATESKDLVRR